MNKDTTTHTGICASPESGACIGCALCTLSCPVWNQTHDLTLTFCGRMRSTHGGASLEELRASLEACVLCGSCAPLCFFGMDTVAKTVSMKAALNGQSMKGDTNAAPFKAARGRVFIAGPLLTENKDMLSSAFRLLGGDVSLYEDHMEISKALETGNPVEEKRIRDFIESMRGASEIITAEGLIYRILKSNGINAVGLGEALIKHAGLPGKIGPGDLYIVDARTYNADFKRHVALYGGLTKETGCLMNLDLHRVATPTGAMTFSRAGSAVDPVRQAGWILQDRPSKRIIAERFEDVGILKKEANGVPVMFITEIF